MANPAPTINQINAFNATQGTTIDFNIIGGTELVRSNRIYIYDLSDNSLICTHLYVSTESIHELPPNTDGSIVYESGKSSADFVNGAQYYAQIQTFTDIAGTEGGSGLSVAKMFWCLVDPTLTITTIPSTISTTSYNVSATYDANTSVVSNIIQQYQFSLYSATGSLLQSSGVVVGSGTQQGTSTAYDISYNFTGLSVGSSYYVVVDVTTTQGMIVSAQSGTFTVSIDTPTLGEATVVNNACDGYISVTSNLSGEYGGSGSGEIVSFETDSENVFTKLQVDLEPVQEGTPWVSTSETEPYLMRISPQFDHDYNTEFDTLVGGTVAWNQRQLSVPTSRVLNEHVYTTQIDTKSIRVVSDGANPMTDGVIFSMTSFNLFQAKHKYLLCANSSDKNEVNFKQKIYASQNGTWNPSTYVAIDAISKDLIIDVPDGYPYFEWYGAISANSVVDTTLTPQIFDLTQMFGSTIADAMYAMEQAHAGDGVAFFRKYFPKAYYAYDAGTLMSVKTSAHKTVGFNQWDEEWELGGILSSNGQNNITGTMIRTKNYIPIVPYASYYPCCLALATFNCRTRFYDIDKNYIGYFDANGQTVFWNRAFTPPQNAYFLRIEFQTEYGTTYNNDICINISKTTGSPKNGDYVAYDGHSYPLDPNLELRGIPKLVNNKLQYNGDVYSSSGNVQRKYGIVDLGTLSWAYSSTGTCFYVAGFYPKEMASSSIINMICPKYDTYVVCGAWSNVAGAPNKIITYKRGGTYCDLAIKDTSMGTDYTAFKTAMSGVYLVYELATATSETAMPFESNQSIVPNGSEEYIDNRTVPIPVGHLTSYADVFPITGHDSVDVYDTGVNIWDEKWENGYYDRATGAKAGNSNTTYFRSKNYIPCMSSTSYYFVKPSQHASNNSWYAVLFYDANKNFISATNYVAQYPTQTTPDNAHYMTIYVEVGTSGATYNNDISINYPSTDTEYHSYQGESYHQDIEATYTPTVQDNTPYLFKQTGDVGGDRETIELVGGTVAWNQLAGGTYRPTQTQNNVTYTPNNDGSFTLNGTANASDYWACTPFPTEGASIVGHKYYLAEANKNGSATTFGLGFGGGSILAYGNTPAIVSATRSNQAVTYVYQNGTVLNNVSLKPILIDLTQMFGTTIADYIYSLEQANTGAGVAFFRKLFPKAYYPYNAGELISVKASSHDTVGKNLIDSSKAQSRNGLTTTLLSDGKLRISGIPTANYSQIIITYDITDKLIDGATYSLSQTNNQASIYPQVTAKEADGTTTFYYAGATNTSFTVDKSTYPTYQFMFQTTSISAWGSSSKTIETGIQLELGSQVTDFEPYTKNTYPLDADLELRGMLKLDISNKLYYDGDTYKYDGSVNRKFNIVELGGLTWNAYGGSYPNLFYTDNLTSLALEKADLVCSADYIFTKNGSNVGDQWNQHNIGFNMNARLYINDTAYTTAQAFKTAMNGVYLAYERKTPTTETADAFEEIQKVTPIYGTEEFVDSRTVPMPVYTKTQYLTRDVYGGYIDLVSGVLVLTRKTVLLNGTQQIYSTSNNRFYCTFADAKVVDGTNQYSYNGVMSEILPSKTWADLVYLEGCSPVWGKGIAFRWNVLTSANDWLSYFASNPTPFSYELAEPLTFQLAPQQIQTFVGQNNVWSEQGEISLAYHIPITNLLVKRQDVGDVSGDWLTLYSQPITQASDMDFTFIDFTNQYGKTYKYALVPLLTQTQSGVEVEVEGGYTVSDEVQSVFDGVFIVDSTGSQKCKANVGYGNVDMNQSVGTITPIGAKYPVVITNSKNQYHNGSIYGTIVPDDYYFNGNLSRIDMVNKRDELEQFLTNKRAKIIKDWNGKIWLVMIMDNVSCTFNNNYGMGIVNFNTNWVEVGDPTNQQDLQATGLINVGGV